MNSQYNTIIYSNMIPFIILCVFLALVLYNPLFNKRQERLFISASILCLFMLIVISTDFVCSLYAYTWKIRLTTTFLNFAISPIIPILLFLISNKNNAVKFYFYIPLILNSCICFISMFTGIIFEVNHENYYGRGPLFFMPFLITTLYLVLLIIKTQKNQIHGRNVESIFLLSTIGLLMFGMFMEIQLYFKFTTWTLASISLPLYYLLLNIKQAIMDPLTDTYNRQMYMKELSKVTKYKNCAIALLDINDFKLVNDTYGHEEGDRTLIKFADIIRKQLSAGMTLYRIGGDEFTIISKKQSLAKLEETLLQARIQTNKHHINFSFGVDSNDTTKKMSELLDYIDQLMYEDKKRQKNKQ